ncbi:MAG: UDP-N-acetylglucosamine 1-carboxyvinyltransferase [Parcubacteria group bacterium]|nr:UDP-N-acetylglucosamine 1-carboxyvinyltransferase [Parcubacteria group bacterium]
MARVSGYHAFLDSFWRHGFFRPHNLLFRSLVATIYGGKVVFHNVPDIRDVAVFLEILKGLGSKVEKGDHGVVIDNSSLKNAEPDPELVRKLRGSVLLMGPLLARFGKVRMPFPGGDVIGARSLDTHFDALESLGAKVNNNQNHSLEIKTNSRLRGGKIVLSESSVTATENALMAASLAEGETVIKLAATEPHIQDLAKFLNSLGTKVSGAGTSTIHIQGVEKLGNSREIEHAIIPDSDEVVSLAVLAASTRSDIWIKNVNTEFLDAAILQLRFMGVNLEVGENQIHVQKPTVLYRAAKIQSGLYPKLMSDQLPPFAVLATQAQGTSLIHEWMYEGRLGYINELIKMGANAILMDPHRALIVGPTPLRGAELRSLDIRAGMTVIIAGLVAEGETVINGAEIIDRGYENIETRLQALGADIQRVHKE